MHQCTANTPEMWPSRFLCLTAINHNKYKKSVHDRNISDYFINWFHQRSTDLNHAPGVGVYTESSLVVRPMSWTATWLHTWPLEQNKDHDWIITNNTGDLMPWKYFSSNGTRHRDTRTGNSASGECTVSCWHQLISARVRASADPGAMAMGNSTQHYARV